MKKIRAILVGIKLGRERESDAAHSLEELECLAGTADYIVAGKKLFKRDTLCVTYCIGKGQAEDLKILCEKEEIDTVVFNHNLTPAQEKNLEEFLKREILDRTEIILSIFAKRAYSREGKLQVELAQLQYLLPRLTRMWTHLSRQYGVAGVRGGPGETQLEVDKRRTRSRIDRLKVEIEEIRKNRETQRKQRKKNKVPVVALIGYTNAGKSTLMNKIANTDRLVEDKLFSSLDSKAQRVVIPDTRQQVLFVDTVGFIKDLPHQLVESFKATLEEVTEADILLHVLDISLEGIQERCDAVYNVLKELKAEDKTIITALNKIDLLTNEHELARWTSRIPDSFPISAKKEIGFDILFEKIAEKNKQKYRKFYFEVPLSKGEIMPTIHKYGQVLKQKYNEDTISLTAELPIDVGAKIKYLLDGEE